VEVRTVGEDLSGPRRVGVAVAEFNAAITEPLLAGALEALERLGVAEVTVMRVPGALELPLAVRALAGRGCQAVVAVGAVIQGETDHYEMVWRQAARGLSEVSLTTGVPVGNAVLTVRDYRHAVERSSPGPGNKGAEAAEAAVRLARSLAAAAAGESGE
jgi:6,7-dimethyl-8-ribityllumazine synthase